jgi:uncharacterized protein YcaQ
MDAITISKQEARRFILSHQGLWPPHQLHGKSGILDHIRRVGCIQFDPLNMAGNNPELVLQARVADFQPLMLQELLYKDRVLLDGWDKMMSIYSVEDWPYFQRRRDSAKNRLGEDSRPAISILPQVRKSIEARGPLSSIDLDFDQTVDWSWAPTKIARAALESMYFWGELVIHHKVHTRKVYDFASNHIPQELRSAPDPNETEEQYQDWYIHRRIGSVGLLWGKAGDAWLAMPGIKSKERNAAIKRLLKKRMIIEVQVDGINHPFYMRGDDRIHFGNIRGVDETFREAAFIAPLDNLLWDRKLVKDLFYFDYRWEVYKPVEKRQYGYYVLPVLYGDRFVARFEPIRDKKNGILRIKNWWWEPDEVLTQSMQNDLDQCFKRFLNFLGVDTIQIDQETLQQNDLGWLASFMR